MRKPRTAAARASGHARVPRRATPPKADTVGPARTGPSNPVGQILRFGHKAGNAATTAFIRQLPTGRRDGGAAPAVQRTIGDGHDLRSNRFAGNVALEAAYDSERTIGAGASGLHVRIVQQALADAGFAIAAPGINGLFHAGTVQATRAFQTAKGLTGAAVTGVVDGRTMDLLDRHFLGHAPDRFQARDPSRTDLMEGTRAPSPGERTALHEAITTEQRTPGGALPTFARVIPTSTDPYEVRVRTALEAAVTSLHQRLVASRPARTPANLMTSTEIDGIAAKAKQVTDGVFGRYRSGPALAFGVNIRDQFAVRDAQIAASTAAADAAAAWRVDKLLTGGDAIKQIDREHGAVQSRAAESALIAPVRAAIIAARRSELLAIHRNWPASAGGGQINLQRYRGTTDAGNRDILYRLFNTVIHEYIHTLEHPDHVTFRRRLPEQRGGFVLREGMTDYFTKMVWDGLNFDATLRATIEGTFHDPANPTGHPIPTPGRYSEWRNAERAAGIVGIRNVMVAFFRGRTELMRVT